MIRAHQEIFESYTGAKQELKSNIEAQNKALQFRRWSHTDW
jgi:hypothetical protein